MATKDTPQEKPADKKANGIDNSDSLIEEYLNAMDEYVTLYSELSDLLAKVSYAMPQISHTERLNHSTTVQWSSFIVTHNQRIDTRIIRYLPLHDNINNRDTLALRRPTEAGQVLEHG